MQFPKIKKQLTSDAEMHVLCVCMFMCVCLSLCLNDVTDT